MKPAPFDLISPSSIADACRVLADAAGGASVLAGGQTLMPLLNLRMSQPFILVDINRIADLTGITKGASGIRIGAATRQCEVLTSDLLAAELPALVEAVRHVGHHQTRNRGTVGGSIALGEPAAEQPATAVALGAEIELHSIRGIRRIRADEFYIGPYMTAIEPDELVTAIHFPEWPAGHVVLFREIAQRPGDFALVGLVGALVLNSGVVTRAGIAWFGMGPTPIKARATEQTLVGQSLADLDAAALADIAITETAPFTDNHATAEYRRTVGRRIFARTLREALHLREPA